MACEDDEPVAAELPGARDALEVVIGDEVSPVAAVPVPAQEADVEALELLRQPRRHWLAVHPGGGERMRQVDDVDGRVEVPAVAVDVVVRMPRVGRLHDQHRRVAEPARAEDEWGVIGVRAPAQAGHVGPARPVRAETDVHEPAPASRRTTHLLRRGHRLAERVLVPAGGGRRARRARGAGLEELERGAVRGAPADVQYGDLAGRVTARSEAREQRRGSGTPSAEHDPEDDCDCSGDCYAGSEAGSGCALPPGPRRARNPALLEAVRRDVHGATVGGCANRAPTAR